MDGPKSSVEDEVNGLCNDERADRYHFGRQRNHRKRVDLLRRIWADRRTWQRTSGTSGATHRSEWDYGLAGEARPASYGTGNE